MMIATYSSSSIGQASTFIHFDLYEMTDGFRERPEWAKTAMVSHRNGVYDYYTVTLYDEMSEVIAKVRVPTSAGRDVGATVASLAALYSEK
jgi:hypothetical protein